MGTIQAGSLHSARCDRTETLHISLKESEERFRRIVETANEGIWAMDAECHTTFVNQRMADMLGYAIEEMLGNKVDSFMFDEDIQDHETKIGVRRRGGDEVYERRFRRKDGEILWTTVSARAVHDAAGNFAGSFAMFTDITKRKKMEIALIESEERYRTLFERAGDGIIVVDIEGERAGVIVSANRAAAEMHGYTMDEFLSLRMSDLDTQEEAARMQRYFASVQQGKVVKTEHYHRRKDGSVIAIDLSAGPLEIKGHRYSLSINRDVSERKKAESERVLLATAVEQAAESVEITDSEGTIVYVNPAFERTTGYSRQEAIGNKPSILSRTKHDAAFYQEIWEVISAGRTWNGNLLNKRKDGSLFEEEVTISPVRDESGTIVNYVAVKRDVTNEVLLQKQLLEAQKMEAVGTLAGGIAHDFNNLLQVIIGFAEVAFFDIQEGDPGYAELGEIKNAALNAAELTQGLLTFSRRLESKLRPVDVNLELERLTKMLRRTLPKMIKIEMNLSKHIDTVNADPAQLQQVIMNLAVNARDAMPNGGTLSIQTKNIYFDEEYCESHLDTSPGHHVLLSISDSGTGMSEQTRKHIFDPFFTTKATGKGTGLGLSVAFGIVKSHGGRILCYSEQGQGTSFKIYLPAMKEVQELDDFPRFSASTGGSETILLVDDEDAVRQLACQVLGKFGYTLLTASNGKEGVQVFSRERHRIDLVILDLIMPEMDGRECLSEILRLAPETKVIIASGYAANGQIALSLEEGAKTSISKPYDVRGLLEAVRKTLDEV